MHLVMISASLCWVSLATSNLISASNSGDPYVSFPSGGKLIGTYLHGLPAYLGIRYATAGRFEVPKLYLIQAGQTINATTPGPGCQGLPSPAGLAKSYAEDCHFLNIFTPALPITSPRAVMFWIHGGCLQQGTGMDTDMYGFGMLVEEGEVVVVSINYRLNLFGFFTAADPSFPKNFGIRDQIAALQWVQLHIEYFGGDPNRVTIFGESAGGISVMALYYSPLAVSLFQRGIVQSAAFQTPAQFQHSWKDAAASMSAACMTKNDCDTLDCMRRKPVADLIQNCREFFDCGREYLTVHGSILAGFDGEVLPSPLWTASCQHQSAWAASAHKPLIVGSNPHEWRLFASSDPEVFNSTRAEDVFLLEYLRGYAGSNESVQQCARQKLQRLYAPVSQAACAVCSVIPNIKNATMIDIVSDMIFTVGAQLHAAEPGGPRYRYFYDMGEFSGMLGTTHSSDIEEIAGSVDACQGLSVDGSCNTGRMMRAYWSSFAKTGVPTSSLGPTWEPVEPGTGLLSLPLLEIRQFSTKMSSSAKITNETASLMSNIACKRVELQSSTHGTSCTFRTVDGVVVEENVADANVVLPPLEIRVLTAIVGICTFSASLVLWRVSTCSCPQRMIEREHASHLSARMLEA